MPGKRMPTVSINQVFMEHVDIPSTVASSQEAISLERRYGAHNYQPLPVTLSRGQGVFVWDVEGRRYYDFLSAYSAVNQGHCHPRIVEALTQQASVLTLTSRAFYHDKLGLAEQYVCELFDYDKSLFMNSGAEAVETAIKLARRWGYDRKKIPPQEAVIVTVQSNFHGRTITAISASSSSTARNGFGPFTPGFKIIPYDDVAALEKTLADPHVCALMIEPIQGEAGVFVPSEGYLKAAERLCKKHHVLLIMDEVQTGVARTGKMLACEYEDVKPDVLVLGKAISGGLMPISCVLARDEIMLCIRPGEHGSTYGGNPLAAAVCREALQVTLDEDLCEKAMRQGQIFRERIKAIMEKTDLIVQIRGKGLLNGMVINDSPEGDTAWKICLQLRDNGLLARPTHGNIIRFAPPLVITEEQLHACCDIIEKVLLTLPR